MWCGLVSCGVVWCGGVSCDRVACLVGCMVCWLLGRLGCLAVWDICWVFGWSGHTVWCLHLVVFGAVCRCMLCDVMSLGTHVMTAVPREGGGADKQLLFLFYPNCQTTQPAKQRTHHSTNHTNRTT